MTLTDHITFAATNNDLAAMEIIRQHLEGHLGSNVTITDAISYALIATAAFLVQVVEITQAIKQEQASNDANAD